MLKVWKEIISVERKDKKRWKEIIKKVWKEKFKKCKERNVERNDKHCQRHNGPRN